MSRSERPLTMLTFAPMIDSECTRRVLGFYDLSYVEQDRLFGWASILTLFHWGYGRTPLTYGRGLVMSGPEAIMRRFDVAQPATARLMPREQPRRSRVEADFALYHSDLSSNVAVFAYYHLLPERDAMIESFGQPITPLGRAMLPTVYGPLCWLFGVLLRLRPARIADVALRIETILSLTDARVADGRRYLVGDAPSVADLGLMSAMAPLLLPPAYAPRVPPLDRLPAGFQAVVAATRARPSGRFAWHLYEELAGPSR